jgi:hypothetical protein
MGTSGEVWQNCIASREYRRMSKIYIHDQVSRKQKREKVPTLNFQQVWVRKALSQSGVQGRPAIFKSSNLSVTKLTNPALQHPATPDYHHSLGCARLCLSARLEGVTLTIWRAPPTGRSRTRRCTRTNETSEIRPEQKEKYISST